MTTMVFEEVGERLEKISIDVKTVVGNEVLIKVNGAHSFAHKSVHQLYVDHHLELF